MYCCDEIHMNDPMNLINLWAYLDSTLSSKKLPNNKLNAEGFILIIFQLSSKKLPNIRIQYSIFAIACLWCYFVSLLKPDIYLIVWGPFE